MNVNDVTRLTLQEAVIAAIDTSTTRLGICELSIRDFSRVTGFSQRSVQQALKALRARQVILVESRYSSDGTQLSNRYRLRIPITPPMKGDAA